FFFFKAEDGIRDFHVTGVQTCALPILGMATFVVPFLGETFDVIWAPIAGLLLNRMYKGTVGKVGGVIVFIEELLPRIDVIPTFRSEERRVGKEGISGWTTLHEKDVIGG